MYTHITDIYRQVSYERQRKHIADMQHESALYSCVLQEKEHI